MNKEYYHTIHQIITAGHWITSQINKELKEFGITEPQYNVLRILKARDGRAITVQEIQDGMVQRNSNVSRIIDKLLAVQLVDRKECPGNRRKMDITLTPSGLTLLKQLDQKVHQFHQPMSNNLSSHELIQLKGLIQKLRTKA